MHPDPVDAARLAIENGADGITAHLREDRRHITDDDLERLQALCLETGTPLNMEMAAVDDMAEIALRLRPHAVCIVPEKREERTTEGGLDVAGLHNTVVPIVAKLAEIGCRVSLFIEATQIQIEASAKSKAQVVEFHTGAYAHALDARDTQLADTLLVQLQDGAKLATSLGLEVHFGHGLTYDNVESIARISEGVELNIGHFIIGEAISMGLPKALRLMRSHMNVARGIT